MAVHQLLYNRIETHTLHAHDTKAPKVTAQNEMYFARCNDDTHTFPHSIYHAPEDYVDLVGVDLVDMNHTHCHRAIGDSETQHFSLEMTTCS